MKADIKAIFDNSIVLQIKNPAGKAYEVEFFDCEMGNLGMSIRMEPVPKDDEADSPVLDLFVTPELTYHGG